MNPLALKYQVILLTADSIACQRDGEFFSAPDLRGLRCRGV